VMLKLLTSMESRRGGERGHACYAVLVILTKGEQSNELIVWTETNHLRVRVIHFHMMCLLNG
jgi:hypothetical protein